MNKFFAIAIAALAIAFAGAASAADGSECKSSCVTQHVVCVQSCDQQGQDQADCKQACSAAFAACNDGCPAPVNCDLACPVNCGESCPVPPQDCTLCAPDCATQCPQQAPDCTLCPSTGTCPTDVQCSNLNEVINRINLEEFRLTLAIENQQCLTRAQLYHFRAVGPCHIVKKANGKSVVKCRKRFFIFIDP